MDELNVCTYLGFLNVRILVDGLGIGTPLDGLSMDKINKIGCEIYNNGLSVKCLCETYNNKICKNSI